MTAPKNLLLECLIFPSNISDMIYPIQLKKLGLPFWFGRSNFQNLKNNYISQGKFPSRWNWPICGYGFRIVKQILLFQNPYEYITNITTKVIQALKSGNIRDGPWNLTVLQKRITLIEESNLTTIYQNHYKICDNPKKCF